MLKGASDQLVEAGDGVLDVFRMPKIADVFGMLGPDCFRPKNPLLIDVFQIISDNVCFLEKNTHAVGKLHIIAYEFRLQSGCGEELGQSDSN